MALHVPKAPGLPSMIKDGAKYFEGVDDAVVSNIDACEELGKTTRTTYGPNGMHKMVINHIGRLFVTNDAAICMRELEVAHPAAKMIVLASQEQEQEAGDGTNLVIQLACAMLTNAAELIKMGLSVTEIAEGYEMGVKKALEILNTLVVDKVNDLRSIEEVTRVLKTAVVTKQAFDHDFLAGLVTEACVATLPKNVHFNVDYVRVCKILGAGITSSTVLNGMVFRRETESDVTKVNDCKVVVYGCPLDILQTDTKGTIRLNTAEELKQFSHGEENLMEQHIKDIVEAGCKVIVSGGKVGELALHYANKYGLLVVRLNSKFDIRRLCAAIGATALPRLTPPTAEECGHIFEVRTEEIGETNVVVFRQNETNSNVATIVVRGSTENVMDAMENAIDDAVNTYKCLTKDCKLVAGAGSVEIEIARQIMEVADKSPGLEQYSLRKYAQSFEVIPKILSENHGLKATDMISKLYAEHQKGNKNYGLVIKDATADVVDAKAECVFDLFAVKYWAIKYATTVACKILRVNQIIMAKPAGGPKPKENPDWDE